MNAAAILLAAGRGERLGTGVPKGLVELDGRSLLAYSLAAVRRCRAVRTIVVVVPAGWEARVLDLIGDEVELVAGGDTRQRSVAAALDKLDALAGDELDAVICHDVARPLAPVALFDSVLRALEGADGAIPVVPVTDTIKRIEDGRVSETLPREGLMVAQTPQAFRRDALKRAHAAAVRDGFEATDDAALLEREGLRVSVVDGDPENIKITIPDDLRLASALARDDG
jgi:2-C-methyl-D-erythritol 4-phosphate cytidylyltransferase